MTTFFALDASERALHIEHATDAVRDVVAGAVARARDVKPDPRSLLDYLGWNTMRMVCVLVVKHRDGPASVNVSRDGDDSEAFFLPVSQMILQPESRGDFVLTLLPKWLAEKRKLMGVVPDLGGARQWGAEQRASWTALRTLSGSINSRIYNAKSRKSRAQFTRSEVA